MDASAKTVSEILHSGDQYLIPFFQRHYKWSRKHWRRLWDDIRALTLDGANAQHFLGPLVCTPVNIMPGNPPAYQLIDGQQPLTTLTVLLSALRDVTKERGIDDLASEITETYLIHKFKKGIRKFKVVPRPEERKALFDIVEGNHGPEGATYAVAEAWRYFREQVQKQAVGKGEENLRLLFRAMTSQLSLVVISINSENPYEIFESLNSTGLPLEQSDLIRNYLFMQVPLTDQEDFHESRWEPFEGLFAGKDGCAETPFYRSYVMRNGTYSPKNTTFVDFKEENRSRGIEPGDQVVELAQFARYEVEFRRPNSVTDKELREAFYDISMLDITTAHPLLMALRRRYEEGQMDKETLIGCLGDLASFVLRRSICGESTRPYGRWFPDAIERIGDDPREDLRRCWFERGWPADDAFREGLQRFPLYRRETKKCRLILERLEASFGHKEKVDVGVLTIEHVMPQGIESGSSSKAWQNMLGQDWKEIHRKRLHALGNLTLTGYNPDMSNKPYPEKRLHLIESKLSLNKHFEDVNKWNEDAIVKRGESLAEAVVRRWFRPDSGKALEACSRTGVAEGLSVSKKRRRAFWTELHNMVEHTMPDLIQGQPDAGTSLYFKSGHRDVRFWAWHNKRNQTFVVGMTFRRKSGMAIYDELTEEKDGFAAEMDERVLWEPRGEGLVKGCSMVYISRPYERFRDQFRWPEHLEWIVARLAEFRKVIRPRILEFRDPPGDPGRRTPAKQLQLDFWTGLRDRMVKRDTPLKHRTPRPSHWTNFAIGRRGYCLCAIVDTKKRRVSCGLELFGKDVGGRFRALAEGKDVIESAVGARLEWRENPEKKRSYIWWHASEMDPLEKEQWPRQQQWLAESLDKLYEVFLPRITDFENHKSNSGWPKTDQHAE